MPKRDELLVIRVQAQEREAFRQAAKIAGVPLSAWVRERLRKASIEESEQAGLRVPFLADLYPRD